MDLIGKDDKFRACYFFDMSSKRQKVSCLFCKYNQEYKSGPNFKHDKEYSNTIIVPNNLPNSLIEEELLHKYGANFYNGFCCNISRFKENIEAKQNLAKKWPDFLAKLEIDIHK